MLVALLCALATPIVQIHLQGEFLDPPEVIERVVRAEAGSEYVPEEPKPPEGGPLPTQSRLAQKLRDIGYDTAFQATRVAGGIDLTVVLHPVRRIRQVFVKPVFGKFPLFEEDILRRIGFRAGQALPPPDQLEQQIEVEKGRIRQFLEREGYFDGQVEFFIRPRSRPEEVNLDVVIYKGTGYTLDPMQPLVFYDPFSEKLALTLPDIRSIFHHDSFWDRLSCLWVCREFSSEKLREDMETLLDKYHAKGYPGARVSHDFSPERSLDRRRKKIHFTLNISTRKKLVVEFRGNHHISDEDLRSKLTFNEAGSYDSFECENSAEALHHAYQKEGYYESRVTFERKEPTPTSVRVTFLIDEGPELKIRGVDFVGNKSFPASALRGVIETKEFPAIGAIGLGEGGYLTNKQLSQDEDRIVDFYKKHGFPGARASGEVATDPSLFDSAGAMAATLEAAGPRKEGDLYVRFVIDEGTLVQVTSVDVTYKGAHRTQRAEAMRHLRLRAGMPLTDEAVKADRDALTHWLHDIGYANAEVKPTPTEEATGKRVVFEINEGPQVRFGQILMRGNFRTSPSVIRRELLWEPGDIYSESKVQEAERNLRLLGLFTTVRIDFQQPTGEADIVHTIVRVEERYDDWGSLEFAGGWATDARAFVTLKYADRNLFGWGKGVELSGTYGERRIEGAGTYIDPRVLGARLRMELNFFARGEETVRLGQIRTIGTALTFSREILPKLRLFLRYDLKQVQRQESFLRPSGPNENTSSIPIRTLTADIGPGIDYDRSDNPLAPTRGFRLSAAAFYATPYLDPFSGRDVEASEFVRFNVTGTGYVPLGRGVMVYAGLRYDHGVPLGGTSVLPKVERFFAGGDTTVRGFEDDRMKTELVRVPVPPLPGLPGYQIIPLGGNIRLLNKLELIIPLWRNSKLPLMSALFFDTGLITNSFDGLALSDFRHSVGIAPLRINTPVGFGSFEYAWALDPRLGDDPTGRFHVNFGFGF